MKRRRLFLLMEVALALMIAGLALPLLMHHSWAAHRASARYIDTLCKEWQGRTAVAALREQIYCGTLPQQLSTSSTLPNQPYLLAEVPPSAPASLRAPGPSYAWIKREAEVEGSEGTLRRLSVLVSSDPTVRETHKAEHFYSILVLQRLKGE